MLDVAIEELLEVGGRPPANFPPLQFAVEQSFGSIEKGAAGGSRMFSLIPLYIYCLLLLVLSDIEIPPATSRHRHNIPNDNGF